MNLMKRIFAIIVLFSTVITAYAQDKTVTVASELRSFYDIQQLPKYISGTHEWQKSSYDTTGGNDDGFSGKYSFVRKNPDGTLVIFEAKGKGVINRIWTPTPNDDLLDFYFDGSDKPSYTIKFRDLFSGKVFPFVKPLCGNQLGGYFCYLPIPYQHGCKIVSRGKTIQFYQVQARDYPADYSVKTFDPNFDVTEKDELGKIAALWDMEKRSVKNFCNDKVQSVATNVTIKPGQTISLFNLNAGGRIVGIEIDPAIAFSGLNKQIDIKITWDGENVPAVYAPLADFFGYSFGSPSMQSLLLGSSNNKNYCYFPMPFDKSAKIELVYRQSPGGITSDAKEIHARICYSGQKRDAKTEGKFYASWNSDIKPATGQPHVYLDFNGRGHYVGTVLQAQGLRPGMTSFFEGDDSTSTDGATRIHGTGSEDSFNGGWYALMDRWDTRMSLPLHGALDYSLPLSRTGGYRLYFNDKLSFNEHILHTIEHGPVGNAEPVDYTSMALYYADRPPSSIMKPTERLSKVYMPDTLIMYPQLMNFGIWGQLTIKPDYNNYIFTAENGAHLRITLNELPYGEYKLYADVEKTPRGADLAVWQRQTQLSDEISMHDDKATAVKQLYLCDISIGDFKNTLTILFKTQGDKDQLTLGRLIFVKK